MGNDAKALKSGVWYTISNILVRSVALITTPIFTRLLSKTDYGNYNNFLSWQHIVLIIVTLNLEASLISAKFDYKGKFKEYVFSILSLSTISVVIWAVVGNLFINQLSGFLKIEPVYINMMLVYCCFYASVQIFQVSERFHYRYKSSVAIALTVAFGTAAVSAFMVLAMENKLFARTLGGILPTVIIGAILYAFIAIQGKHIDVSSWKYALKVCVPFIPHLLSLTVLNSIDRVMINRICGPEDTALYSVAYSCGAMVTILLTSMNTAFSPWLGDNLHEKNYLAVKKFSKHYILAFCGLALGIMLLAPEVLMIMGGHQYLDAKYVMTPVAMGCVCQFLYTMYVNVEQYEKKTIGMAFASAGAALVNLVLNAIFIPMFGYYAAAYTTLAGYLFLLIIHMLLVRRYGYSEVYNNKFVIQMVCVMILFTICISFLYGFSTVRYITVALYVIIMGGILYKKRNAIKRLLMTLKSRA